MLLSFGSKWGGFSGEMHRGSIFPREPHFKVMPRAPAQRYVLVAADSTARRRPWRREGDWLEKCVCCQLCPASLIPPHKHCPSGSLLCLPLPPVTSLFLKRRFVKAGKGLSLCCILGWYFMTPPSLLLDCLSLEGSHSLDRPSDVSLPLDSVVSLKWMISSFFSFLSFFLNICLSLFLVCMMYAAAWDSCWVHAPEINFIFVSVCVWGERQNSANQPKPLLCSRSNKDGDKAQHTKTAENKSCHVR